MTIAEQLATQIRVARKWAGVSQSWLARKLDVSDNTVRRWEYGVHSPDVKTIGLIAELLGVSTAWLLGGPSRIRATRRQLGKTQGWFAQKLGVAVCVIRRWESGREAPSAAAAARMGKLLGVSPCWLMGGPETQGPRPMKE